MQRFLTLAALVVGVGAGVPASDDTSLTQTQRFRPKWQVGDQWTVETQGRQPQTASPKPSSVKARWRFAVEAVEPVGAKDCFRIAARPVDAEEPKTVVWIDRKTTAIRQIQTQLPTPAGYKTVTESYQSSVAAPVVGPLTVLPIALPQFPEAGLKSPDAYQYDTISGPGGIKAVGDVGFSTEIRQSFSVPSDDRIKGLFDDEHIKSLQDRPIVEVQLSTPDETIRQVWTQDAPWPLFADNGLTQARLVQTTRAPDGWQEPANEPEEGPTETSPTDNNEGIKNLETRDGLERGNAQFIPWSGYWWPIRQGRLLVPLGKYDRLTGRKAAVWERKHNPPGPDVPQWHGYCHAWAAASVLELEPAIRRMVRTTIARLGLEVGDQKGLLTACHTEDLANSWGDRFGDGEGSEDRQDLRPDLLWRLLKLHLGQQGVPLVLDVESGEEVWNYPIYDYEIQYKPSRGGTYMADLTLLMADDAVPPDYRGTKTRKQTYQFRFKMREGSVISGSGEWIGRSKQDHPDFAWYPFKAVAANPEVKYVVVRKLVDGTQDDGAPTEEPPTPETPPTEEPEAEPGEPATPPSEEPGTTSTRPKPEPTRPKPQPTPPKPQPTKPKPEPTPPKPEPTRPKPEPTRPKPEPTRPKPDPTRPKPEPDVPEPSPPSPVMPTSPASAGDEASSTRPQPSQDARVIVLSPMELVALIANKTSSFAFDAMLDRFDGASYRPGDTFFLRVKSERAGYLYLLHVDSTGTPALIYPTASEDNRIPAGKLVDIRPRGAKAGFPVFGRAGVIRIKAVVTSRPLAFSGSLDGFHGQTRMQSQGRAKQQTTARRNTTVRQQQVQIQHVQFRWHPTQRQQVQQILSQEQPPADAEQLGCRPPQEILGPFAQDMMTFYIDTTDDR